MARSTVAALAWMPARSYGSPFKTGRPIGVAVHCTESDNGSGTAESLAGPGWFGGPAGTSAHKMFDRNSGVEMVRRTRVSYHAGPKGNVCAISYEFCGRAGWSREKWHAPEQLRMLDLAAPHIADDLRAVGAPARWLSLAQLAAAARTGNPAAGGLFTHNDIRLALGGTTHTDPGKNFPYAYLLDRVLEALGGRAVSTGPRTLFLTDPQMHGEDVEAAQRWAGVEDPNGWYGPATEALIRTAQAAAGLEPDGRVGPATRERIATGEVVDLTPPDTRTDVERFLDDMDKIELQQMIDDGARRAVREEAGAAVLGAPVVSAIDGTAHPLSTFIAQGNKRVYGLIATVKDLGGRLAVLREETTAPAEAEK